MVLSWEEQLLPPTPLGKHRHLEGEEKWQTQQSAFVIEMIKISLNSCPEEGDTYEQEWRGTPDQTGPH